MFSEFLLFFVSILFCWLLINIIAYYGHPDEGHTYEPITQSPSDEEPTIDKDLNENFGQLANDSKTTQTTADDK